MANSRKSFDLSQLRVGIFVLFGLAILAFLILNSTGDFNPFQKKLRLKTRFGMADGLRSGSEVQLAGVRIGKVEVVQLMPPESGSEETIEAVMLVDQEIDGRPVTDRVRSDSKAQLMSVSLLASDKLINITPGTAAGSPVEENSVLESTTTASVNTLTQEGNELLKQINLITVPANEILNKANRGEGTLGRVVNDESLYRNLDTTIAEAKLTIRKLQLTLDKANTGDGTVGRLLNDKELYENLNSAVAKIETITGEIRAGKGTAGKIVNDDTLYLETRSVISELRTAVGKLNLIFDDVSAGKGTIGKLFKDDQLYGDASVTLERFNKAATRIESLIADAQAGKGTLGKLVTDDSLFNNVSSTSSSINKFSDEATKLLYDFRQNPKKFLRIKLALF